VVGGVYQGLDSLASGPSSKISESRRGHVDVAGFGLTGAITSTKGYGGGNSSVWGGGGLRRWLRLWGWQWRSELLCDIGDRATVITPTTALLPPVRPRPPSSGTSRRTTPLGNTLGRVSARARASRTRM